MTPIEKTCANCAYYEELCPPDDDEPSLALCGFPHKLLPLSMQGGMANRERRSVRGTETNCPDWCPNGDTIREAAYLTISEIFKA